MGRVSLFHSNACKLKIDNYLEFYKNIVDLWIRISVTDPQSEHDILSQTLWNNKYILVKRNTIFFLELYQKGINTINDLIDERGFFTWNRLNPILPRLLNTLQTQGGGVFYPPPNSLVFILEA